MTNAEAQTNLARRYRITVQERLSQLQRARAGISAERDPLFFRDLSEAIRGCEEAIGGEVEQEITEGTEVAA
jgi:hypothetical protein